LYLAVKTLIPEIVTSLGDSALLSDQDQQHYHTLGGLAMFALGRVPRTGDTRRLPCRDR
jgi:CBS domain containing-hemolysin-like protein